MTLRPPRNDAQAAGVGIAVASVLILGGLLIGGIAALAASFVPFEFLLARVRGLPASGQSSFFTPDLYHTMQLRLRLIGAGNVAAAMALFLMRQRMVRVAQRIAADLPPLARDVSLQLRSVPLVDTVSLVCLVFFAAILRISHLFQPMRYDEAYTFLQYSSRPFYAALSFYNAPNNHLFHTLLVRLAYLLFGNNPWTLRLPVFLAGLLLVPATYAAARSSYRDGAPLLAAGLVASSSVLIEYSTNARGYCIVCLIFLLSIPIAACAIRNRNWAAWVVLGIGSAVGFYTIPIMLYPFGGIVLWLLLSATVGDVQNVREVVAGILLSIAVAIVLTLELYAPVFAASGPKAVLANKWVVASPFHIFLHRLGPSFASTWREWNRDLPSVIVWMLVGGFLICAVGHRRCSWFRIPLTLALVLWVIPLVFVQRVVPFERVWLFALPLYFVGAAAGLGLVAQPLFERLRVRHAMTMAALAISFVAGIQVEHSPSIDLSNEGRGLEALAISLKGQLRPGDSVVAGQPSDAALQYYFQTQGMPFSYLNTRSSGRMFVVVNGVSGDTVQSVLQMTGIAQQEGQPVRLLTQFDSASLYEVTPLRR